jgi:CRISPR-associated protein (TIGR03984 family)
MSKQLNSHEGVYTKTSGTCGLTAEVNVLSTAKEFMKHDGLVIAWSVHEVKWGYYKQGVFQFSDGTTDVDLAFLQDVRIFNDVEELRLTVQHGEVVYRYISDEVGESVSYVDSTSRLIGENNAGYAQLNQVEGFTYLVDTGRKLSQIIPISTSKQYCYLTTRNYIGYLDNYQASYTDYRYVKIADKEV